MTDADDGQAAMTEVDRAAAVELYERTLAAEHESDVIAVIAVALAAEREKARAPFLALAEELEREGRKEEAQAIRYGKAVTAESWWGSSAASLGAAKRIRRAGEEGGS